jgi:hypothetical protein
VAAPRSLDTTPAIGSPVVFAGRCSDLRLIGNVQHGGRATSLRDAGEGLDVVMPSCSEIPADLVGQSVPGHTATETDHRQPRQPTSEIPETKESNVRTTNQLVLESIDTEERSTLIERQTSTCDGCKTIA